MNNDKDHATLYAELEAERFMTDQISLLHEAEDLADGINFMLKSIGEFTDADRAYVFETSENHTSTNTYEWCAAGVTSQIRNPWLNVMRKTECTIPCFSMSQV